MSDHEYSQGIRGDGVAILKDGQPMTIEEIVDELQKGQAARTQSGQGAEPSGVWQFYQNGEWHTGMNINNHRKNTEAAGFPTRDLYTHPQPAQSWQDVEPVAWWDGDTVDEETAFQFERDAIYKIPVYTHTNQPDSEQGGEWRSPSDLRSDIDVRVKLKDGSVIENCLSQSDGDFYWKGSGTEMFILEHEVVGWMPQPPKSKEGES